MSQQRTTLITGANSGLGWETARQLLARDGERVILTARSREKAEVAREALVQKTGAPIERIDYVLADFMRPDTVEAAVETLTQQYVGLDGLVLNAGGVAPLENGTFGRTERGFSTIFAMNVGGHAQFVHGLLEAGLMKEGAAIVFSSSEAVRGIPGMKAPAATLPKLPGTVDDVVRGVARGDHLLGKADPMTEYALVKQLGTAWIQHLAREHQHLRIYAISPGASSGTSGHKNMPMLLGTMMKYVMMPMLQLFGRAHGVSTGALRYIAGLDGDGLESGGFYASPYPHISGNLVRQSAEHQPLLEDSAFIDAVGRMLSAPEVV